MTRTQSIKIRLTESEHRRLKTLAGARGISAFLRRLALGRDHQEEKSERFTLIAEIARLRNILCQVARNSEQRTLPEQAQVLVQLIAVERELVRIRC